jgi:alpha/beta superfamily hydrolase
MAEVIINGPAGRLEGRFHQASHKNAPLAIVLHPHPQHGGTMNNKVVYTLYKTFAASGFNTLRFNFRGVGKSEGVYDHGDGELSDAACVLDWLQAQCIGFHQVCVAGFSFGAWIALQLVMRRPEVSHFIAVSPPANLYDFSFLTPCPVKGYIIQGRTDKIVECKSVENLSNRLKNQKGLEVDLTVIDEADHFFTNKLDILNMHVQSFLKSHFFDEKRQIA